MKSFSPCLRVSVVKKNRRGQTIIIALAILFLLVLLGATFVTTVVRNLQRVTRHGDTDEALTQALAGLTYAANQFRTSQQGADWRPRISESLWRDPLPDGTVATQAQRDLDYDSQWLDPLKTGGFPYVRVSSGQGHFLLRVTYVPSFKDTSASAGKKDEFDLTSGLIHIESVGRGGVIDPNDPTTTRAADPQEGTANKSDAPDKPFRKVEAWVPVGLTDQLWWITNNTNEKGPAPFGAPPFTNPSFDVRTTSGEANNNNLNRQYVSYPAVFEGGVRSDVDLNINGATVFRFYPSRGEALTVKGNINVVAQPVNGNPQVIIQVVDDNQASPGQFNGRPILPGDDQAYRPTPFSLPGPTLIDTQPLASSTNANFNTFLAQRYRYYNLGKDEVYTVQDEAHQRNDTDATPRSARQVKAPSLDQLDSVSGASRWLATTRDSGATLTVTDGAQKRIINTGWYSLTDSYLAAKGYQSGGVYLDNFGDIQHPENRASVKDDWLRRGSADLTQRGWLGDYYVPSVTEGGTTHPIMDIYLTQRRQDPDPTQANNPNNKLVPILRVTRYDLDQRQLNLGDAAGKRRLFYDLDPATGNLLPAVERNLATGAVYTDPNTGLPVTYTFSRDFEYPPNGVVYCEGSVRVHGVIGATADLANGLDGIARQLTVVSGGTIYIEGNLVKPLDSGGNVIRSSFLGLLAHDFVTLNPTAFNHIQPGNDVVIERDPVGTDSKPAGYHFVVPQGGDLDFTFSAADVINQAIIHVKHTAKAEDASSETALNIFLPSNRPGWPDFFQDRFNVGKSKYNPVANFAAQPNQSFYLFHQIQPPLQPGQWSLNVAETSNQTSSNSPAANYEYKTFYPTDNAGNPTITSDGSFLPRGLDATFRMLLGYKDGIDPNTNQPIATLEPNGQPYWLSRLAVLASDRPLPIKVEAVMYAYTGSWFIIPPPFFNDNPVDTRPAFVSNGQRAAGTYPNLDPAVDPNQPGDVPPFYNEALNIDVDIHGCITENMPAAPEEVALWTSRMWVQDTGNYDPTALPLNQAQLTATKFRPYIHYRYDEDLRRMVRARAVKTNQIVMAWTAPGAAPPGLTTLGAVVANGATAAVNSYVETLPVLPGLPSSELVYEGNPL